MTEAAAAAAANTRVQLTPQLECCSWSAAGRAALAPSPRSLGAFAYIAAWPSPCRRLGCRHVAVDVASVATARAAAASSRYRRRHGLGAVSSLARHCLGHCRWHRRLRRRWRRFCVVAAGAIIAVAACVVAGAAAFAAAGTVASAAAGVVVASLPLVTPPLALLVSCCVTADAVSPLLAP